MLHRDLIVKRNPFTALDSMLDHFFSEDGFDSHWMRSDIEETDKSFQISVDLPGVQKDQVEVSLEEGNLIIEVTLDQREKKKEGKSR